MMLTSIQQQIDSFTNPFVKTFFSDSYVTKLASDLRSRTTYGFDLVQARLGNITVFV